MIGVLILQMRTQENATVEVWGLGGIGVFLLVFLVFEVDLSLGFDVKVKDFHKSKSDLTYC